MKKNNNAFTILCEMYLELEDDKMAKGKGRTTTSIVYLHWKRRAKKQKITESSGLHVDVLCE